MSKVNSVEVTWADQQNINSFGKLNNRKHELLAYVKAKKQILEELEDASNELMLSDEEQVRYVIGECFVHIDREAAEARIEAQTAQVGGEIEEFESELEDIKGQMADLKKQLYGKFGNSINLEDE